MMDRRRILSGLIAAPFVARLGIIMPVRAIEAPDLGTINGILVTSWRTWPAGILQAIYQPVLVPPSGTFRHMIGPLPPGATEASVTLICQPAMPERRTVTVAGLTDAELMG